MTYNVSDAAGNAATEVTRVVNVTAPPVLGDTHYCWTTVSQTQALVIQLVYVLVGFNQGQTDEWFTVSDPNIEQTPEGTIHFKSNNSAPVIAILRYKLNPISLLQVKATRFYLM